MRYHFGRRLTQLLVGLFLYGIAISAMVQAAVGLDPWDVLTQGLSLHTGIPFGIMTNIIGLGVLLLWIPLRQRPGIGTVLNALLVGPSAQLGLAIIPSPDQLWLCILLFAGGLVLLAMATGLYIGAHLGPGPRDGLMTGLHARTGRPIWMVRTGIEVTVLIIGWILGGNVGFGTLAFALLIGTLVHWSMPIFAIRMPEEPAPDGAVSAAVAAAQEAGAACPPADAAPRDTPTATAFDRHPHVLIESDVATRTRWDYRQR